MESITDEIDSLSMHTAEIDITQKILQMKMENIYKNNFISNPKNLYNKQYNN
jgi:hypothetical protein